MSRADDLERYRALQKAHSALITAEQLTPHRNREHRRDLAAALRAVLRAKRSIYGSSPP